MRSSHGARGFGRMGFRFRVSTVGWSSSCRSTSSRRVALSRAVRPARCSSASGVNSTRYATAGSYTNLWCAVRATECRALPASRCASTTRMRSFAADESDETVAREAEQETRRGLRDESSARRARSRRCPMRTRCSRPASHLAKTMCRAPPQSADRLLTMDDSPIAKAAPVASAPRASSSSRESRWEAGPHRS